MTPRWAAGTLYPTGSLVQPLTGGGATSTAITNPGFESGATDWALGVGMSVGSAGVFAGTKSLACTGVAGVTVALHDESPVNPGQSITASCMYQQGAASAGRNVGQVFLRWFTSGMVQIGSDSDGSQVTSSSGGYKQSSVTATAPPGAAFVSIGGKVNRNQSNPSYFDNFAWNYAQAVAPAGLIYKAVQPTIGTSDATEPVWPLTVGLQVVDNTVIWEALIATRITYEASPILLSGNFEPTWPESIGGFVSDNTISWEAVPQQVIQAPQSKVVTIASSKVYAADGDIVRYCATVNPLDWTSEDDAGYLPTGLNQYGSNRTVVLNTYRGNVVAMSASTFGNWQVDPDPANITLLDSMEGIGSTYQQAAHPVSNDLFYLAAPGVRTVGIAAGTSNLAAGDVGMPIDPLVQASMTPAIRPLSSYWPGMGQYWLMMRPPLPIILGPSITGAAPDGVAGAAYSYQYLITAGDSPIVSVEIIDGEVMPGMNFNTTTGELTGPSYISGTMTVTIEVTDENGLTATLTDTVLFTYTFDFVSVSDQDIMLGTKAAVWNVIRNNVVSIGASNRVVCWGARILSISTANIQYSDDNFLTNTPVAVPWGATSWVSTPCKTSSGRIYVAVNDGNIYYTDDGGPTWHSIATGIATTGFVAGDDSNIIVAENGGPAYALSVNGVSFGAPSAAGFNLQSLGYTNGRFLFGRTGNINYAYSDDNGATRIGVTVPNTIENLTSFGMTSGGFLLANRVNTDTTDTLFARSSNGSNAFLYVTTPPSNMDGGTSNCFAERAGVVMAVADVDTGGVTMAFLRSPDFGINWTRFNHSYPSGQTRPNSICAFGEDGYL